MTCGGIRTVYFELLFNLCQYIMKLYGNLSNFMPGVNNRLRSWLLFFLKF